MTFNALDAQDSDAAAEIAPPQDQAKPTCLYRHFDDAGQLLYVGISLKHLERLAQHRRNAHWYDRIKRIEIERFPTWEEALAAEAKAIIDERPECNIAPGCTPQEQFTDILDRFDPHELQSGYGKRLVETYRRLIGPRSYKKPISQQKEALLQAQKEVGSRIDAEIEEFKRCEELKAIAARLRSEWLNSEKPNAALFDRVMRAENMLRRK